MVNQNIYLEQIFHLVTTNKLTKLTTISQRLNLSLEIITKQINKLQLMGLPISVKKDFVELTHLTIPLDVKFIQSQFKRQIIYKFSTNSTNTLAKNHNQDAIFLTEHQLQGRGQHGKSWLTPLGQSIALSLSQSFELPLASLAGLNIAIGVAVIKSIKKFSNDSISLKWPNDIIGSDGKVAGILIEAHSNNKSSLACIGIGINWSLTKQQLASINQLCMNTAINTINRSEFIIYLLKEINYMLEEFIENKLTNIIHQWNKFDLLSNQKILITTANDSFKAKYLKVTPEGLLMISVNETAQTVSSGSIQLL